VAATELKLGPLLRAQVERGSGTHVALVGTLDEGGDLTPLTKLPGPITIDLGELRRMNSIGVRHWMDFVRVCERSGTALVFERCSPVIVGQITMITRFMGSHSHTKSLLAPYICAACKAEHNDVIEVSPAAQVQSAITCPKCGGGMELDDLVENYVEALRRV
jgi:anti-anti-sigma regulatory factor